MQRMKFACEKVLLEKSQLANATSDTMAPPKSQPINEHSSTLIRRAQAGRSRLRQPRRRARKHARRASRRRCAQSMRRGCLHTQTHSGCRGARDMAASDRQLPRVRRWSGLWYHATSWLILGCIQQAHYSKTPDLGLQHHSAFTVLDVLSSCAVWGRAARAAELPQERPPRRGSRSPRAAWASHPRTG